MQAVIGKGGSVREEPVMAVKPTPQPDAVLEPVGKEGREDKLKSFTIKIYESELAKIRSILEKMPKRDRLSIHDFIVAATQEKITRDTKKANR